MTIGLRFDKEASAGTPNQAREDFALGDVCTIVATNVVGTATFQVLARPPGSASSLVVVDPVSQTIVLDVAGRWRFRVGDTADGSRVTHTVAVPTERRRLVAPAHNERSSEDANEADTDPGTWVGESESNLGGRDTGYAPDLQKLVSEVEKTANLSDIGTSTGNLTGGLATVNAGDSALVDIAAGVGVIIDTTDPENPVPVRVPYGPFPAETIPSFVPPFTGLSIDINGDLIKRSGVFPTAQERRSQIHLQNVEHIGPTPVITAILSNTNPGYALAQAAIDQLLAIGAIVSGNVYEAAAADLTVKRGAGTTTLPFINQRNDPDNPSQRANPAADPQTLLHFFQDGEITDMTTPPTTIVNVANYNPGPPFSGLSAVSPANRFQIMRLYLVGAVDATVITHGQALYQTIEAAEAAISSESPTLTPLLSEPEVTFRAVLIVRGNALDLSYAADAKFVHSTRF